MTQSKHTPGPWDRCTMTASKIGVYTRDNRRKEPIAVLFMGETDEWKEFKNSKANADLIAAAPELLEALEDALITIGALSNDISEFRDRGIDPEGYDHGEAIECQNETINKARAAIAKAKGGA